VRAGAADAAAGCGAAAVDPLLRAMEQDKAPAVRWKAAAALGAAGDARARPALEKAARGDNPELQHAAKQALGKLK
jgi:HEAT repeat protein